MHIIENSFQQKHLLIFKVVNESVSRKKYYLKDVKGKFVGIYKDWLIMLNIFAKRFIEGKNQSPESFVERNNTRSF